MKKIVWGGVCVVCLMVWGGRANASALTLYPLQDAEIMRSGNLGNPVVDGTNFGSSQYLTTNYNTSGGPNATLFPNSSDSFGLLQFDLSSLPAGVDIQSATLGLYAQAVSNWAPEPGLVSFYRLTSGWEESLVTYNSRPGQDATVAGAMLFSDAATGSRSADITSLVRAWYDGTVPNYGLITSDVHRAVGSGRGYVRFYAREYPGTARDPYLTISYEETASVPEPGSLSLLGLGLLGLWRWRRKAGTAA